MSALATKSSTDVRFVVATDPFGTKQSRRVETVPHVWGAAVGDYIPSEWDRSCIHHVSVCGAEVPVENLDETMVPEGAKIVVVYMPGFFGLDILGASVAVAGGSASITTAGAIALVIDAILFSSLSFVAQKLLSPPLPDREIPDTAHGHAGIRTGSANGAPISVVYGRVKVGGQVIDASNGHFGGQYSKGANYSASNLNLTSRVTIGLCHGPIRSIGGITSDVYRQYFTNFGNRGVVHNNLSITTTHTAPINGTGTEGVAASFVTTQTSVIDRITVSVSRTGTLAAGSQILCTIYGGGVGGPSGNAVFEAVGIAADTLDTSAQDVNFDFDPVIFQALSGSNRFWAVFTGDYAQSGTNHIRVHYQSTGVFLSETYYSNGSSWVATSPAGITAMAVTSFPPQWSGSDVNINGSPFESFSQFGSISTRLGNRTQDPLPDLGNLIFAQSIDTSLPQGSAVTHTTDNEVDSFGVVVQFVNGAYYRNSSGQPRAINLIIDLRWRAVGSSAWTGFAQINEWIQSLGTDGATYRFDLNPGEKGSRIEVEATRQQPTNVGGQDIKWGFLNEYGGTELNLFYPKLAVIGLETQVGTATGPFESITAVVEGKTGWFYDGTDWAYGLLDNPADCCIDWALNETYGAGDRLTLDNVDLPSFVLARNYCNELIDNGKGGTMKRWVIGKEISRRQSWWKTMQEIAACGNFKVTWDGGVLAAVLNTDEVDSVSIDDTVMVFTDGNIDPDSFELEYMPDKDRANRITVEYRDEDEEWNWVPAVSEDPDIRTASANEVVEEKVRIEGITNAIRAEAYAKSLLNLNKIDWRVSFTGAIDAIHVREGDVIEIGSSLGGWENTSGRIQTTVAGNNSVRLDRDLVIEGGKTYTIKVWSVNTTTGEETLTERTIDESAGTYAANSFVDTTPTWPGDLIPQEGDLYSIGPTTDGATQRARVTSVTIDKKGLRKRVEALHYPTGLYDLTTSINRTRTRSRPNYGPDTIPPKPANLALLAYYWQNDGVAVRATWSNINWRFPVTYSIWAKQEGIGIDRFLYVGDTANNSWIFRDVAEGSIWTIAVTPKAYSTGWHHNPASRYVARQSIRIDRQVVAAPAVANGRA